MKHVLIVLLLIGLGAGAWFWFDSRQFAPESEPSPPVVVEPGPVTELVIEDQPEPLTGMPDPLDEEEYPAATVEMQEPLPGLMESDPVILGSLTQVIGQEKVAQNVVSENIVSRVVATVDALTGRQVSGNLLPLQSPQGAMEANVDFEPALPITTPQGDTLKQYLMDPVNYRRYSEQVDVLESLNTDDVVANYLKYQPLFQQAYLEQGYPDGNFNQRLLEVMDHLLDAPRVEEPVRLIKPEAYYQFADPELESLSAGHKLMIRMGNSNATRVKAKLRELQAALLAAGVE
jgi:hypothetical protein